MRRDLALCSLISSIIVLNDASGMSNAYQVVGIADGDTITVLDSAKTQHKIRLAGVDAP